MLKAWLYSSKGLNMPQGSVHLVPVEKVRQRRSLPSPKRFAQAGRSPVVLSYSVYTPRANCPVALLDGLFEQYLFHLPWEVVGTYRQF